MLEIPILILSVIANTILGLSVYIKNPQKDVNRLFFYLTLSLAGWASINYFSLHPFAFSQIVWVRLVLGAAAVLCYFVLTSFAVFPDGSYGKLRLVKPATVYLLFVVILAQTPLVFKNLTTNASGGAQPVIAPGIIFFMLLVLSFLGGALWLLLNKFHHARGAIKNQLRIVIAGITVSFVSIVATNFLLVSFFSNTSFISLAPLLALILTGSMAYAILKHKLFDLRLAVARALAYILTFSLVLVFYAVIAFFVGSIFNANSDINTAQKIFFVSLAVVTAIAFQPSKKFFDKTTNRLFYKDAYDPQVLLDEISNILVSTMVLEPMLEDSSKAISQIMRLENCGFMIRNPDKGYRLIGANFRTEQPIPEALNIFAQSRPGPMTVTDELTQSQEHLRSQLASMDLAAIVKLSTKTSTVGYMLVGNKKSGNILNSTDIDVLDIATHTVAIAAENALRFEEIRHFNVTLQDKVDEATRQLRHANQRLKVLDQTKDEFISMASHQLRTPLTTIKGYLSMVLEGDVGPVTKDERKMIQQAFDSSERMVFLIADLLNVSRLQSGKFVIENKPTDLAKMVETEVAQLKETAQNHHLTITYKKPDKFPMLSLDDTKIRQVVMNFMDNAIFYTPAGGSIEVATEVTDKEVSYTVTDTGLGVPKAEQHHLFSKFYRAGNARKMRPDGTGLGLFMAKKVIAAQGGAIIFKSTEGKGSTFGFSFPLSKVEIKSRK